MNTVNRLILSLVIATALTGAAVADDGPEREARALAKAAGPDLRKAGHTQIAIAPPVWADGRAAETAAGMVEAVAGAFADDGFVVKAGSPATFTLTLESVTDRETGQPACQLRAALRVGSQERAVGRPRLLLGESAIARLLAPRDLVIPPKTPERDRVGFIVTAAPPRDRVPAQIKLEMLVKSRDGTFLVRTPADGKIETAEFETYILRLTHCDPKGPDYGVELTIDGARWDEFAEGQDADEPKGRMILVKAGQSVTVRGWFASASKDGAKGKSLAFDVVSLPVFAAASKPKIGVITAQCFPVWVKGTTAPAGEERAENHRSVLGTAALRPQEDDFTPEERLIGRLREVHSLRYGR